MKKIKLSELVNIRKALPLDARKASFRTKYKIVRFIKDSADDAEFYETELSKIIQSCAQKDENGHIVRQESGIPISEDKSEEFVSKTTELDNTMVDCPELNLTQEEAGKLDLTVESLLILDDFISKPKK